ncbi:MAG: hypothetical protein L3J62_07020 [Gammaproteobacteria bacterium]|nr:hypothetical protein [Gammaproteobacteria bacterium]MCF6230528.1 hypothetical protein [Gammaproteobacteria bacterium]
MKNSIKSLSIITLTALLVAGPLQAAGEHDGGHGHDHGSMDHGDHSGQDDHADHGDHGSAMGGGMFLVEREIDGYDVTFHVMKAKPGKEMGGSHDFMIKVEKDGKALSGLTMNTKVVHPSGESETKKAMKMGDWMMAGYDLGHGGKHQLMILFKTADGEKHKGGVYYPQK